MVGDILRSEREKQRLTIKDVENETSIRALYIEAIEKGDQKALPSEVYVKGFIRNYADFLHLDADALARQYREEIHGIEEAAPVVAAIPVAEGGEHGPFSSGSDFRERVQKSHRTQNILVTVGVILIAFIGSIYYFFGDEPAAKQKPNSAASGGMIRQEPPVVRSSASSSKESVSPAAEPSMESATAAAASVNRGVEVSAKFTGRCWIQAVTDGKVVYEGTAEPNQTLSWKGADRIAVTVGNAGAVDIVYNGRSLGRLGKEGDVVEKRFTRDKVEDVK
ncbi:MAG: helix-turn-helix domain-containing protein [Negativicutes bacterium]